MLTLCGGTQTSLHRQKALTPSGIGIGGELRLEGLLGVLLGFGYQHGLARGKEFRFFFQGLPGKITI